MAVARSPFRAVSVPLAIAAALAACQPAADDAGPGSGGRRGTATGGAAGTPTGTGGTAGSTGSGGSAGTASQPGGGAGGSPAGGTGGGTSADAAPAIGGQGGTPANTTDAGTPERPATPVGPGKAVLVGGDLPGTFGVAVDPLTGDMYSADYGDNRVRKVGPDGKSTIVMGPGAPGAAGQVTMNRPHNLLFQPKTRNLFVADTMGSKVLRMNTATGAVEVLAGNGGKVPAGGNAFCLAFDPAGETLYFTGGGGIRVVDLKTDTLETTIAFGNPRVIAVDSKGTLYAVRNGGNALQTVTLQGQATNVPGGGPLNAPKGLAIDNEDNVIIVDTESHSILKYQLSTKSIVRILGTGRAGTGALDGSPLMTQTDRPHGAFVDSSGRILISDSFNDRIIAITY